MEPSVEIVSMLHGALQNAPLCVGYIDPGTGSMLLTILVSLVTAGTFAARKLAIKAKYMFKGGKAPREITKTPEALIIFSDHKRYWTIFEAVCDELERRGMQAQYWTGSPDDPALQKSYEHVKCVFIGEGNAMFVRLNAMKASICLSTTPGLDVLQWKRSKDTRWYVHTFHAIDDGTCYRMFGLDHYDAVLGNAPMMEEKMRALEELRGLPAKEFYTVGSCALDRLQARWESMQAAQAKTAPHAARVKQTPPAKITATKETSAGTPTATAATTTMTETQGTDVTATATAATAATTARTATNTDGTESSTPTILLAPSWGPSAILSRFGAALIEALLQTDYRIVVRPHPQSLTSERALIERLQARFCESAQLHWDTENDNFAALSQADVLITDFSGIIFEYCFIFNRPLLYADTSFDPAPYDAAWLDEPMWTLQVLPAIGRKLDPADFGALDTIISEMLTSTRDARERERVRDEGWQERGRAAQNIVDYLVKKLDELSAEHVEQTPPTTKSTHAKKAEHSTRSNEHTKIAAHVAQAHAENIKSSAHSVKQAAQIAKQAHAKKTTEK